MAEKPEITGVPVNIFYISFSNVAGEQLNACMWEASTTEVNEAPKQWYVYRPSVGVAQHLNLSEGTKG